MVCYQLCKCVLRNSLAYVILSLAYDFYTVWRRRDVACCAERADDVPCYLAVVVCTDPPWCVMCMIMSNVDVMVRNKFEILRVCHLHFCDVCRSCGCNSYLPVD